MTGTPHQVRAEDTAEKKSGEMAGRQKADLNWRKAERLARYGVKRAQRSDSHLNEQGRNQQCGQRDQQAHGNARMWIRSKPGESASADATTPQDLD